MEGSSSTLQSSVHANDKRIVNYIGYRVTIVRITHGDRSYTSGQALVASGNLVPYRYYEIPVQTWAIIRAD